MPRLFTGLELPQLQRSFLQLAQAGLKDARWIDAGDMHVTLRFIGDVSPSTGNDIVEALAGREWKAPDISLSGWDAFGGRKPRLVYASVADNEALIALQRGQEQMMQYLGLPPEHRKFTPHVTVGRLKSGTDDGQVARWLAARGPLSVASFKPARFVLYSARQSTGGGPYRVEQVFSFQS